MPWKFELTKQALEDLKYFKNTSLYNKCFSLLEDILENPFSGKGKIEKLRYIKNMYSRRINKEHRLVYIVHEDRQKITVLAFRYHYKK
jgi:toxin YoeB